MLHTTARLAQEADACGEEYEKVARALGGEEAYGLDTPVPLTVILEHTSLESALWSLRCVLPGEEAERDRIARLFACDCAEAVLPLYERDYPDDGHPRAAIETARRFATGQATWAELAAARDAAWGAARAAAWGTAWDAAWAAAWAAAGDAAGDAARGAAWAAARTAARTAAQAEQSRLFRAYLDSSPPG